MRLVLDAVGNKHGGGATVLLALLEALDTFDPIRSVTLLRSPVASCEFVIPSYKKLRTVEVPEAESSWGRFVWGCGGLDKRLKELEYDVFMGLNGVGSTRKHLPSLVFIQQSLPFSPEALRCCGSALRLRMAVIRWITKRAAKAANHVLVQTETMRKTVSRAFGIPASRISAFTPNASVLAAPSAGSEFSRMLNGLTNGALLYVGNDAPFKNLGVMTRGLCQMPEASRPKLYLTLPSDHSFCHENQAVGLGKLSRAELHEAYRNATLLVMPSLVETVGLPMLEAMSLGLPVLAADRPYAHEVCEDAAVYFDPLSPEDFAKKVAQLLDDPQLRARLIERGTAVIKRREGVDPYRRMLEKVVEVAQASPRHEARKASTACCDCKTRNN